MIFAVVVLYNKCCKDSKTLQSLYEHKNDYEIVIVDNSTQNFGNESYCETAGYTYFGFGENRGLSKAYNYAISHVEKKEDDYFLILDDDTELTQNFHYEVKDVSYRKELDVVLPIVRTERFILSPSNVKYRCGSKIVSSSTELNKANITAINSGMLVKASVYDKIQYNEKLFLDCVDHDFMKLVRENNFHIGLLKNEIRQNYSREETPELESALFRFEIFRRDFKVFCIECNNLPFFYLSMFKLVFSYSIKYRTIAFFKVLFRHV